MTLNKLWLVFVYYNGQYLFPYCYADEKMARQYMEQEWRDRNFQNKEILKENIDKYCDCYNQDHLKCREVWNDKSFNVITHCIELWEVV